MAGGTRVRGFVRVRDRWRDEPKGVAADVHIRDGLLDPRQECSTKSGAGIGWGMSETPFKRLLLRAVLRDVYPMVIRLMAVPDYLELRSWYPQFRAEQKAA
jgi:hypothetical protein